MEHLVPDYTSLTFPAAPVDRPYVIVNMVSSVDGRVVVEGTERGLGSPRDQRLMRELRVHADVTLNGAGTLRASGTSSRVGDAALEELRAARGLPRAPIASVLTRSGDLPLDRLFFTARDFDAVVYVSEDAPPERVQAIEATGRPVVSVPAGDEMRGMLAHMHSTLNARLLLVEGGPTINGQLFELGCVDEFFLTLGGVIVNGNHPKTAVANDRPPALDALTRLELISAIPNGETDEVYLRYRVRREVRSSRS